MKEKKQKREKNSSEQDQVSVRQKKGRLFYVLLTASVLAACAFLASPLLMRWCDCIFRMFDSIFEGLRYSEYKSAFIGAAGGMIGSFLAITGSLWVERKISKDNDKKEIEKIALILYYDIKMFYQDTSLLATNIARLMKMPNEGEKQIEYQKYKKYIGIYFDSEWIRLVASLKGDIADNDIKQIYSFYGDISNIRTVINKSIIEDNDLDRINDWLNKLGCISDNKYIPNDDYIKILKRLKEIAKYDMDN